MTEPAWQKSSFSSGDGSTNCIELATSADAIRLRESDDPTTVLTATTAATRALLAHLKTTRVR